MSLSNPFEGNGRAGFESGVGSTSRLTESPLDAYRLGGEHHRPNGPTINRPVGPTDTTGSNGSGSIEIPPISTVAGQSGTSDRGVMVAWGYGPAHRPTQRFYLPFYSECAWVADRVTDALVGPRR